MEEPNNSSASQEEEHRNRRFVGGDDHHPVHNALPEGSAGAAGPVSAAVAGHVAAAQQSSDSCAHLHHPDEHDHLEDNDECDDEDAETSNSSSINKDTADIISNPVQPMDVICGRGSRVTHPGNKRFRTIVLERKEAYQKAQRRDEKTRITQEIVDTLTSGPEPSRFLLKDTKTNEWYDVGIEYAKEKVSHALRSRPNEERRKRNIRQTKNKQQRPNRGAGNGAGGSGGKPTCPPELEETVKTLISDQQQLLKSMIQKESFSLYS